MSDLLDLLPEVFKGVTTFFTDWKPIVMILIGIVLIVLAIKKEYEPNLLLPIGFGAILVNIPFSNAWEFQTVVNGVETVEPGFLQILYNVGIKTELFPILIFIAIGAMIDFKPLLKNPFYLFFGAAAQFGIFATMIVAIIIGYPLNEAATIGILGTADGPTSIFVSNELAPRLLGPITVAAYSYMALVPVIQPPVIKLLTTKKERKIRMEYKEYNVSRVAEISFPIIITLIAGLLAPSSVALIGSLMFGNLLRVCDVTEKLSKAAQNELSNLVTLVLGITIGGTMRGEEFLNLDTLAIMGLGLLAFIFDTAGGVIFAKILNLFRKEKINPCIGAAGISAFPMSSRVVHKLVREEDPDNFVLMQSVSANVSGQIGSVVAGSLLLALVPLFM